MMNNNEYQKFLSFLAFVIGVINIFYGGLIFMFIWNWIPAVIFNLSTITYAQGLGLFAFTKLLRGTRLNRLRYINNENKKGEEQVINSLVVFVELTITVIFAFIVQAFI